MTEKVDNKIKGFEDIKLCKFETDYGREYYVNYNDSFNTERMLQHFPYQWTNLKYIYGLFKKSKELARVVIDIGMNIGMNTIEYSAFANTVHSFEPNRFAYGLAKMNIKRNQQLNKEGKFFESYYKGKPLDMRANIRTYNIGLGDAQNIYSFVEDIKQVGLSRMYINGEVLDSKTQNLVDVTTKKLDSYEFKYVDFIKIDVEGFELAVLHGAEEIIQENRPIIQIEIDEKHFEMFQYEAEDIFEFMDKFDNYVVTNNKGVVQIGHKPSNTMNDRFWIPAERLKQKTVSKWLR